MAEKRACSGTTKAGKPCKAPPLRGTDCCLAHSPAETRESVGFIPDNGFGGRKPIGKPDTMARALVSENILIVQRPYWLALGFDVDIDENGRPYVFKRKEGGAKLSATFEGVVNLSNIDDLGAMIAAAEKLQDRAFGKPKQVSEVSGPNGEPVRMESGAEDAPWKALSDEDLQRLSDLARGVAPDADDG